MKLYEQNNVLLHFKHQTTNQKPNSLLIQSFISTLFRIYFVVLLCVFWSPPFYNAMALNTDSPRTSKWKYHVFLSFRGKDTRLNFTDHLYAALQRNSIETFRDEEELRTGEFISDQIVRAIEESLSAIVIISPNYATSAWCLDELQKIVESKGSLGLVVPVFYDVDPSDVRYQKGSFEEAFKKHEKRFRKNKGKVQEWRDALKFVANLSGCTSKDRHEAQLIEGIVAEVWKKLDPKLPTKADDLVAIDSKVNEVYSCLSLESEDVLFVGIWGMGGLGKTTLASEVYMKIHNQFEVHCILCVGEVSKEGDQGLVHLQNKLLSHLKLKHRVIETLEQGKRSIRSLLCRKKILIVLDDVRTIRQLENLAGNQEWFGPGSRIIVTTRDQHLLKHRYNLYEMKILNNDESHQLFHQEAFKGEQPKEECLELSKEFIEYAGGLPLALKVLGSNLYARKVDEWGDALDKIRKDQPGDIMNMLRISYDMLEEEYKTIFLDIACFFKGWYRDKATKILKNCGLHSTIGLNVLIEKSLVICDRGVLGMHDLLEEMGKGIASKESRHGHGCSRLCSLEDIDQALGEHKGTEKVEGVVLKQQIESYNKAVCWRPRALSKMRNLRLLIILCDLHLSLGLERLPSSLKVIIWVGYPLKTLPLGVELCELVHLQMNNSKVEQLWNGNQVFEKLKVIDLSYSNDLIQTPNISNVPLLEELFLDGCVSLVKVHQSVGQHKKLAVLSLIGCIKLETLPRRLEMCSLKRLFLCSCSNMKTLPDFGETMECLSVLNLMNCSDLLSIPDTIGNLKSLKLLNLSGCSKVCWLPDNINENKALEDLDLSETSIRVVNPSLFKLENLKRLSFRGCSGPVSNTCELPPPVAFNDFNLSSKPDLSQLTLPPSVSGLSLLNIFDLSYCNLHHELIPKDFQHLSSLETLILSGNTELVVPDSIAKLPKLRFLEAEGCSSFVDRSVLQQYLSDSRVEAGVLLDLWKFWKLFKSIDSELLSQVIDHSYPITYLEIPPKFGNEILFPMGTRLSELESSASIMVDIPNECCRGEWWGIVVFIAFEALESPNLKFSWSFEASHPEAGPSLYLSSYAAGAHYDCCLVTMIMSDKYIYIQLHHRAYGNISLSKPFSQHRKPDFSESSRLRFDVQGEELKMTECGYHVLCKEDFRSKALPDSHNRSVDKPRSGESSRPRNAEETEIREDGVTASNRENSSERFSSISAPFINCTSENQSVMIRTGQKDDMEAESANDSSMDRAAKSVSSVEEADPRIKDLGRPRIRKKTT